MNKNTTCPLSMATTHGQRFCDKRCAAFVQESEGHYLCGSGKTEYDDECRVSNEKLCKTCDRGKFVPGRDGGCKIIMALDAIISLAERDIQGCSK